MNSEPHDVEKQASAIAHEYFWCIAGRHQACIEQLQESFGTVPYELWLNLCFESIVFGLSFFGEYARNHYTESERELFVSELDTATRWLLATTLFDPGDIAPPPSQAPQSVQAYPKPMDFNERA